MIAGQVYVSYPQGDTWDNTRNTYVHNSVMAERIMQLLAMGARIILPGDGWCVVGIQDESFEDGARI